MAHMLMIQTQPAPYAGTAYLNGAARSAGHEFSLFLGGDIGRISKAILEIRPDLIGFSCMTCFCSEILHLAGQIKKISTIPIILGGPHPTLFPDVINDSSIDMICRGEGEFALMDLLAAIDAGGPVEQIPNLWVKKNGAIHSNDVRRLAEPLDRIPLIDWSCYTGTPVRDSSPIAFLVRGCPYSCTYCFNEAMRGIYRGRGRYVRHFSVERSLAEIDAALRFFRPNPVLFNSDSFGMDLPWMEELLAGFSRLTALPFVLLLRPELATERCIEILAKYRCHSVAIGVESGSERVRKEMLNRRYSNSDLLNVAHRLHARGIRFRTYNMIGLPSETEAEIWETIHLNIQMGADFPRGAVFTPMPNTRLAEIAKERHYLGDDFECDRIPSTILSNTILKGVDPARIQNLLYFFQTAILFPGGESLIRRLLRIHPNRFFKFWFYLIYAYLHRKSEGRAFASYLRYLFYNRKHI